MDERDLVDRVALDQEPRPWWSIAVEVMLCVIAAVGLFVAFVVWLDQPSDVGKSIVNKCAASSSSQQELDTCIQSGFEQQGFTPSSITPSP